MEQANLNYINELSGDNIDFKNKIIAILKRELPEEIAVYKERKSKNDLVQMAQSVHKLKHKISILGLEKSYYIASEYENNLKSSITQMQTDFEQVLDHMQEFVAIL
jgi:HPt (histidine-containing phosphotransfer) domain-containing protein